MKYRVYYYCTHCYMEDFQGCFGGLKEYLEHEEGEKYGQPKLFDTREEAIEAGEKKVENSPWEYRLEEVE